MRKSIGGSALLLCLLLAGTAAAAEKSLYWSGLDVEARLEADGTLRVIERQSMVFDGEWNGGERRFNLRPGQSIALESLEEIDPASGTPRVFVQGDLDSVGEFAWHGPNVLRWRSRLPSDPLFEATGKRYVLTYAMSNVLTRRGDRYRLSHDFAFADRPGVIERFTLDLQLDPVWQPGDGFTMPVTVNGLTPGSSYVLNLPLRYTGSGTPLAKDLSATIETVPASQPSRFGGAAPASVRHGAAVIFLLIIAGMIVAFVAGEVRGGRFAPLDPAAGIDREWLQKNVFDKRAEVIGAAWDEKTGGAEVAAMLARLALEGKIRTRVEEKKGWLTTRSVLHLEKCTELSTLPSHERWLLEALFVGKAETDTDHVREVYRNHGFDPVAVISENLENSLPWKKRGASLTSRDVTSLVVFALGYVVGIIFTASVGREGDFLALLASGALTGFALAALVPFAHFSRKDVNAVPLTLVVLLVAALFLLALFYRRLFFGSTELHPVALLLLGGLSTMALRVTLKVASTDGEQKRIVVRKRLLSARRYFVDQLRRKSPTLDDSWFPYLLAFGLGRHVDRWFRAFGGASAAAMTASADSSIAASSSSFGAGSAAGYSIGGGWSGGGASFGGAGATGSWSVAASQLASSIPSPSTSSGGGSGSSSSSSGGSSSSSSSGGSSGGGGGGGW